MVPVLVAQTQSPEHQGHYGGTIVLGRNQSLPGKTQGGRAEARRGPEAGAGGSTSSGREPHRPSPKVGDSQCSSGRSERWGLDVTAGADQSIRVRLAVGPSPAAQARATWSSGHRTGEPSAGKKVGGTVPGHRQQAGGVLVAALEATSGLRARCCRRALWADG